MARRPNIVWLNADHYAYAHHRSRVASYPSLPAFDRVSSEGVRFDNAYTVTPLCSPARGSLLTGQYPHNHGMINNTYSGKFESNTDFDPGEDRFFNHELHDADYATAYFGKWHAGEERLPRDFGFEGWSIPGYGLPYTAPEYAAYLDERGLPEPVVDVEWIGTGNKVKWIDGDPREALGRVALMDEPNPHRLMNTTGRFETPAETHEAFFVTQLANDWLEDRVDEADPFFLRVDPWGPHHPYWVTPEFADTVDPRGIPEYPNFSHDLADRPNHHRGYRDSYFTDLKDYAWADWQPIVARCYEQVALVDHAFETVLDTLDRLGLADETLVIYSADHGDIIGSNGGLFDKGWLMTEETMRIPMAMRWPDEFPRGRTSDALVSNLDIVASVVNATGEPVPHRFDGRSVLPLAADEGTEDWRNGLLLEHHGHLDEFVFQRMLREGRYKYVAHLDDRDELYELAEDPFEMENLVSTPEMADVAERMRAELVARMRAVDDDSAAAERLISVLEDGTGG